MPTVASVAYKLGPRRLLGCLTGPRVLVASVPKSGTHMLTRTLGLFPQLRQTWIVLHGHARADRQKQIRRLSRVKRGQFVAAHLPPWPELVTFLQEADFRVLFIYRDPRDLCVSLAHYLTYMATDHPLHPYFAGLPDDEVRLMTTIVGFKCGPERHQYLPNVRVRMEYLLTWRHEQLCCPITFEELVGPMGGGRCCSSARGRRTCG